jgi:hypothetical protein
MDLTRLTADFLAQLKWIAFNAQYCASANFGNGLCVDFRRWTVAVTLLVSALILLLAARRLWRLVGRWHQRRAFAAIADTATMDQYRWNGDQHPGKRR